MERLRSIVELLPEVKTSKDLLEESKELQKIGSGAANCALGLGLLRLGSSIEEERELLSEGYEFLEKDLDEDLKMVEEGPGYPIFKRAEKHYDPEKMIKEAFPKHIKPNEKITGKEIRKIRLEIGGWKKTLKKLLEGNQDKSISDKKLEKLQAALTRMGKPYIIRANVALNQYSREVSPSNRLYVVKKKEG